MDNAEQSFIKSLLVEKDEPKRRIIRSIKAKANAKRKLTEKLADWMTSSFGSMTFLTVNFFIFSVLASN